MELAPITRQTTQVNRPIALIICGVCGCGKTTVGAELARQLEFPYLEADDFHPAANVKKMSSGEPLSDEDRWPWLHALAQATAKSSLQHGGAVTSCSALKASYRRYLTDQITQSHKTTPITTRFMLLHGDRETIRQRMASRPGHFMPESLLDSQLRTLQMPDPNEPGIQTFDIVEPPASIVHVIRESLMTRGLGDRRS